MILTDINKILGITDSYQAPSRIMEIIFGERKKRDRIFYELGDYFKHDYSYDWFYYYFSDEHADRKNLNQDFTPISVSRLISSILGSDKGITYEPAAGTGGMLIANWHSNRSQIHPFDYVPINHIIVCHELSDKTIPFLLLNFAIRGIDGIVFHGNALTGGLKHVYVITNNENSITSYSEVILLNLTP